MSSPRLSRLVLVWLLCVLALLLPWPVAEATGPAPKTPPAPSSPTGSPTQPAASPIPMAEVATRAAQVSELLRSLAEAPVVSAETETIRSRVHTARAQMDLALATSTALLDSEPTLDVIQSQEQLWQQRQIQVKGWLDILTQRAMRLQNTLNRLAETRQTWLETRRAAVSSSAPAAILSQIDTVLAAIETAEAPLAAQRTIVLDLQTVVAQEVTRSADMLARFTEAQQRAMGGILSRDAPPLWSAGAWARADTVSIRLAELGTALRADVLRYVRDPSGGMPLHAALLVILSAVFLLARWQARGSDTPDGDRFAGTAFVRPYAAATLLTLFFVSSPMSSVPQALRSLSAVLTLLPAVRLTRPVLDPRLRRPIYVLALLFATDTVREAVGGAVLLEQVLLVLEVLTGIAGFGYAVRRGGLPHTAFSRSGLGQSPALRVASVLVMLVLGVSLIAGTAGYMRLGRLLASTLFAGTALALTLYASVPIVTGLFALALNNWPLRALRMVEHHRELFERRVDRTLFWLALVAWTTRVLDHAGLFQPTWSLGQAVLAAKLGRGAITFSLADVLEFVGTVWLAYLISAFVRFVLDEDVYPRTSMTRGFSYAISSLLNYIILTLGFLLALGTLGLDLTKVTVLASAFGIGLGFGLQSIVNNFVSGLILLFERPVHVGDIVEMGDLMGEVSRIGIRASTVRTYRGAEIIVPNAQFITERVTNWTLSDRRRRVDVAVGVDYGSAPEKVVEVLEAVARGHPDVLKDPAPHAFFIAFADSAINFELRAWTNQFDRWMRIQTELAAGVYAALAGAGMSIPFPQRDVRVIRQEFERPRTHA